jgi:hypothetical protein
MVWINGCLVCEVQGAHRDFLIATSSQRIVWQLRVHEAIRQGVRIGVKHSALRKHYEFKTVRQISAVEISKQTYTKNKQVQSGAENGSHL